MITTLTLNPAIDKAISTSEFKYGGLNIVSQVRTDFGGKGINVSKVLANFSIPTTVTGFAFESDYSSVKEILEQCGIICDFIICPGKTRVNTKLFDEKNKVVTELNEKGTPTNEKYLNQILEKMKNLAKKSEIIVCTGSLPPNCPIHFYKDVIEVVQPHSKVFLDCGGKLLEEGIKAKPMAVKPNLYELEQYIGHKLNNLDEIKKAALQIVESGVEIVCVSMGKDGAMITNGSETFYAPGVEGIEVKSTVCAGDSMVAGLCYGLVSGHNLKESFAYGVAAATGTVTLEGSQIATKPILDSMLCKVKVIDIK